MSGCCHVRILRFATSDLIGSGMIWNIYFASGAFRWFLFLYGSGFGQSIKPSPFVAIVKLVHLYFRGSPLFIQFFFAYFAFVSLKGTFSIFTPLSSAWLGALFVLFCNIAAYAGEIFWRTQSDPKRRYRSRRCLWAIGMGTVS